MKIPKAKAIELIDKKIKKFEDILKEATYEKSYNENYDLAYSGTEMLLSELFSKEEAKNFRINVTKPFALPIVEEPSHSEQLAQYQGHIEVCISQLKAYRERIENFRKDEVKKAKTKSLIPFVSMSFKNADRGVNQYVIGILDALKIKFKTGERYSKHSIPQKVKMKSRIRSSDLLISIFVKRDKLASGGYTTPTWLIKELNFAQGKGKDVIAWVEKGIKDIAGLNLEKELIYFEREDVKEMEKATIKFLEALKEHQLI